MTTATITGTAAELDAIMADLDATGAAWEAAGYGYDTPECEAREAVFARLHAWNEAREQGPVLTMRKSPALPKESGAHIKSLAGGLGQDR